MYVFIPHRISTVINNYDDLLKVLHLQVMAKEEMTLTQKIKFKHIQGFYKVTVVFKTGNPNLLKGETLKNGQSKMHILQYCFDDT